jgi:hypothetical protein
MRQLAEADLVEDLSGLSVPEVVELLCLPRREDLQRRSRKLGDEWQRLVARDEAVTSEDGHEPGKAGSRKRCVREQLGRKPQRREIDQAAFIDVLERVPVGVEARRRRDERVEAHTDVRARLLVAVSVLDRHCRPVGDGLHEDTDVPVIVRRDRRRNREAALVDARRLRHPDPRLAHEVAAPVAEHERVALDAAIALAGLRERVLDLEQVGEVRVGVEPELELERLDVVVEHRDVFVEAVADRPVAVYRDRRVLVDGPGGRHEEVLRCEVLRLVGREDVQRRPVRRQLPARKETCVSVEEALGLVGRGIDVPAKVTDEERAAVEDADRLRRHLRAM